MLFRKLSMALCVGIFCVSAWAQKGETVKIAWIDPLSGLMAPVGSNQLKTLQYLAEEYNKGNAAGVKFEIIGLDNKLSPAESLNQLKAAMDQGVRYITQGNGSSVAGALVDAAYIDALTPLMWAAGQGHTETVRLLLAKGANKTLKDDRGLSAMDMAKAAGHTQIVNLLQ